MRVLTVYDDQAAPSMRDRVTCFLDDLFPGCACAVDTKQPVARLVLCEGEIAIAGHLALYRYEVRIANLPMEIGVIGEVAIKPEYRGKGLLTTLIPQAHNYFQTLPVAYSMIFPCHPAIFADFGYRFARNGLFVRAGAGTWQPFTFYGSMYCALGEQPWPAADIHFLDEPCQT